MELNEKQKTQIEKLHSTGTVTKQNLADYFGVALPLIDEILSVPAVMPIEPEVSPKKRRSPSPNEFSERRRQKRRYSGGRHHNAKLTVEEVLEIRARYDSGEPLPDIAKDYDTSPGNVSNIGRRDIWKHIPEQMVVEKLDKN